MTNPITALTKGTKESVKQFKEQSTGENIGRILGTTAVAGAAVVGGGALLGSAGAKAALGKTALEIGKTTAKTTLGTPGRAATTLLTAGVLTSSPTVRSAALNLPKTIFTTGKVIGETIEKSPDKDKFSEVAAKTLTLGAGAGLLAGALMVTPAVVSKTKDILTKEKTPETAGKPVFVNGEQIGTMPAEVQTMPETTPGQIKETRKKRRKPKQQPIFNNSVKLINKTNIAIAR
jgi:hypothetical protein